MDQAQTAEHLGMKPGSRGFKLQEDDEARAVKLTPLKAGCSGLMKRYRRAMLAMQDFHEFAAKVGADGNCHPAVLKRLVRVSYRGKFAQTRIAQDAERDIFEALGEVPGGESE